MFNPENFEFGRNFIWFIGVVEQRIDPNFLGRVQVRCFGFHNENREELPTEDLPWAMVMQSVTSAAQTEVGESPTGLVEGSWVVGFFLDGEEAQQPLVLGSLGGYAAKPDHFDITESTDWDKTGFKDVREPLNLTNSMGQARRSYPSPPVQVRKRRGTKLGADIVEERFVERYPRTEEQGNTTTMRLARGAEDKRNFYDKETSLNTSLGKEQELFKEPLTSKKLNENKNIATSQSNFTYDQPTTPYRAVYPFNHVKQTESGHVIEYDDTPSAERIHEYHRSGTFREIHPSGKSVTQTMNEKYDLTESNSYEYVKGSKYETYKRGFFQLINDSEVGGADAKIEVAGSSNYLLTVNNGNYKCLVPGGDAELAAKQRISMHSNEIVQTAHLLTLNIGNLKTNISNDITLSSTGMIQTQTGSHHSTTKGNYNIDSGDNFQVKSQHSVLIHSENNILNPSFYVPIPTAMTLSARLGNIEINAQDGDTKIAARPVKGFLDMASVTVTSALPTSITSIFQPQPSPELENQASHPGSIIAQTKKGYIYLLSMLGNIVLETQTVNSIKLKTTPLGSIEEVGGQVSITSTMRDVDITSRMDTTIETGFGFYSTSGLATEVKSHGQIYVKAGINAAIEAKNNASVSAGVAVRLGSKVAHEPAIKGQRFLKAFLRHVHLTPMGPTSPVFQGDGIVFEMQNAFCKKTFVF